MGLNLHAIVRGAIGSVNPDRLVSYLASTGYVVGTNGKQAPSYADPVDVSAQIQPLSPQDLKHEAMANVQGITRAVYLFGNTQGVVRIDAKGGDLLKFSQSLGGTVQTWLVVAVLETWTPDAAGWCKVGVSLQVTP